MDDRAGAGATSEGGSGTRRSAAPTTSATPVALPADTLADYERFSLYNSPYPAHDRGCAVDLYPDSDVARSPVAGVVRDTRTVRCPPKPYAADRDHLILVDVDAAASGLRPAEDAGARETGANTPCDAGRGLVARVLHVDPAVDPGDEVAVGDPLGETVRSGFFGRWVDDHVHLGFRGPDANPYRASGSLPVAAAVDVEPVPWDGTGTVVETGPTHALLDAPAHPAPDGDAPVFAAIADDAGRALDGGLAHYSAGGLLSGVEGWGETGTEAETEPRGESQSKPGAGDGQRRPVSLLGCEVGVARGRDVTWGDVALFGNDRPLAGLSLLAGRDALGAKLVAFDREFAVGDEVSVSVDPTDDPVRLD